MSSTLTTATPTTGKGRGTKGKAKQLFQKLFDSDKAPKPDPPQANYNSIQDLTQSFGALSLPNPNDHRHNSAPQFVGGFAPRYTTEPHLVIPLSSDVTHPPYRSPTQLTQLNIQAPSKLQRPPSMPLPYLTHSAPQSSTMQMALRLQHEQAYLLSTNSPAAQPVSMTESTSTSFPSLYSRSSPQITKPKWPHISSTPSSSGSTVTVQQCAGITKAGKPCSRQVKSRPALSNTSDSINSATIERFCFQHTKELLEPSGFYARKNGLWVDFDCWIPHYLQLDTQVALRIEMEKARSKSDVHGYIYTFEIRETHNTGTIKLKVGRAVNLVKRIDQWGKQCGSKEQILRGWYPGTVEVDEDGDGGSFMKGRIRAGERGAWCHRLERLVHLELADLAATSAYLDPAWPKLPTTTKVSTVNLVGAGQSCADCGTTHKEIFELKKITSGRHKGKEWESVIKPIIERWGLFVSTYV